MEKMSAKDVLAIQADKAANTQQAPQESNPLQDTWNNAVPAFNNAASFDTADQKQPSGQPAGGLGAALGSTAGTVLRTGISAGVGAGLGSVVPGAGTVGGAVAGGLAGLGIGAANARLKQQTGPGGDVRPQDSDFSHLPRNVQAGYAFNALAPLAIGKFVPGAKGLVPNAAINAGVGAGTDATNQAIDRGGIDKVDLGQTARAGLEGAAFGSLQHMALGGLGKLIGDNKAGGNPLEPNYGEGQLPPSLEGNANPQGPISPSTPGGQALEGRLAPIGVGPSGQQAQYEALLKQYAAEHHAFPRSAVTQDLARQVANFGVDPQAALAEYLDQLHARELRTFSTGYDPQLSQSMDNTVNQARQDQWQNVKNSLQGISNYDTSVQTPGVPQAMLDQNQNAKRTLQATVHYSEGQSPETPWADQGAQYGQVGPEQSGVDIKEVLRQLHEGEIDLHDVQDWLDSQDQQNLQLQGVLQKHNMQGTDFTGVSDIQTPNADAAGQQLQAQEGQRVTAEALQKEAQQQALLRTAEQTTQWGRDINAQRGQQVTEGVLKEQQAQQAITAYFQKAIGIVSDQKYSGAETPPGMSTEQIKEGYLASQRAFQEAKNAGLSDEQAQQFSESIIRNFVGRVQEGGQAAPPKPYKPSGKGFKLGSTGAGNLPDFGELVNDITSGKAYKELLGNRLNAYSSFLWRGSTDTDFGGAAASFFMHSTNLLKAELGIKVHVAAGDATHIESVLLQPTLLAAEKAGYSSVADDAWQAKLFQENDLVHIRDGQVDYRRYMGHRYSEDMVTLARYWADARIKGPEILGYPGRARYDERRRYYFDSDKPMYDMAGKGSGKTPEELVHGFLLERKMEKALDLHNNVINTDMSRLQIFASDMKNMAAQHAFQPVEFVNGKLQLKSGSVMDDLYTAFTDKTATKAQRNAAKNTITLVTGRHNFNKAFGQITAAYQDSVLTNNFNSAFDNFIGLATMTDVGVAAQATTVLKTDIGKQILKNAGLENALHIQKSFYDPDLKVKMDKGDFYQQSERYVRAITYIGKIIGYAKTNGLNPEMLLKEVATGKSTQARLARGYALQEVQNTQGMAHRFSARGGATSPAFFFGGANASATGRTLAQAHVALTTGDVKPFLQNVGIRLVIGGGKALVDPTTSNAINMLVAPLIVDPDARARLQAGMMASQNAQGTTLDARWMGFKPVTIPSITEKIDELAGTNLAGAIHPIAQPGSIPGMQFITGKAAPLDLSSPAAGLGNALTDTINTGTQDRYTGEEKYDMMIKAAATLASLIPQFSAGHPIKGGPELKLGSTIQYGNAKISATQIARMFIAGRNTASYPNPYQGVPQRTNPVQEAVSVVAGGNGPGGHHDKMIIQNRDGDYSLLKNRYLEDTKGGRALSPGGHELLQKYVDIHGDQDFLGVPKANRVNTLQYELTRPQKSAEEKQAIRFAKEVVNDAVNEPSRLKGDKVRLEHMSNLARKNERSILYSGVKGVKKAR